MMGTKLHDQPKAALLPSFLPVSGVLQRKCACGGAGGVAGDCEGCSKEKLSLQRSTQDSGRETQNSSGVPPIVHEVLGSPGQPLDQETRAFMEPRFGHDFGSVRVHTDTQAAKSAGAVSARAYTVGHDVVFGNGQYAPATGAGKLLLAHELAHTVQQGETVQRMPAALEISHASDPAEQEADAIAKSVMLDQGSAATSAQPSAASQQTGGHVVSRLLRQPLQAQSDAAGKLLRAGPEEEGKQNPPAAGNEAKQGTGTSDSGAAAELTGLCIRTPFEGGRVRFQGCSKENLSDFAVIPESGTATFTPVSGVQYDSDGFWWRHHLPKTEWFKVSDHCDLDVTCTGSGFSYSSCCNAAASLFMGTPHWESSPHGSTNPF
jgi:hypothetical protein